MTTRTDVKPRALLIHLDENVQYDARHHHASLVASVLMIEEGDEIKGPGSWVRDGQDMRGTVSEPSLRDLKIDAAMATNMDSVSYGWETSYVRPYGVNLERAEEMVKALRFVTKKLAQLEAQLGRPQSFGQYLNRVAQALGVTVVLFERPQAHRAMHGYASDGGRYRRLTIGEAVGAVDSLISKWHQEHPSTRVLYEQQALSAG